MNGDSNNGKRNFPAVIIFLLACGIYLSIVSSAISPGDGPEFTTAAYTLGIPHPPGYPFWMLSARLFTSLPLGNIGWRANLVSSTSVALASMVIFLSVLPLLSFRSAVITALVFITALPILRTVSGAEVYPQLILLIALMFFLLVRKEGGSHHVFLAAFLSGIGLAVHYLSVLFLPGWLLLSWVFAKPAISVRKLMFSLSAFVLGMTLFVGLPLRAVKAPLLSWGRTERADHFIKHVKRSTYMKMERGAKTDWQSKRKFAADFFQKLFTRTYPYGGEVLLCFGLVLLTEKNRKRLFVFLALFLLPVLLINLVLRFQFNQLNLSRLRNYYLPAYLFGAVIIGQGYQFCDDWFKRLGKTVLLLAMVGSCISFTVKNYEKVDQSSSYQVLDLGENLINQLPKHTIFFAKSDAVTFPLWFMQAVNNRRLDVSLITTSFMQPSLFYWYRYHIRDFYPWMFVNPSEAALQDKIMGINPWVNEIIAKFFDRQPIYYELNKNLLISERYLSLDGIAYRVLQPNAPAPGWQRTAQIVDRFSRQRGIAGFSSYVPAKVKETAFLYTAAYYQLAKRLHHEKQLSRALYYLGRANDIYPGTTFIRASFGLIYEEQGKLTDAAQAYRELLVKHPDYPIANLGMSRILTKQGDTAGAKKYREAFQKTVGKTK